jgi:hypothetical protein
MTPQAVPWNIKLPFGKHRKKHGKSPFLRGKHGKTPELNLPFDGHFQ